MFFKQTLQPQLSISQEQIPALISQLSELLETARKQALRLADSIQMRTCWKIGRHIVEFEQQCQDRATYGAHLVPKLAESLTAEFVKGFYGRNLRYMRAFFQSFPIWMPVRTELSWTHYRNLLRIEDEQARNWYMQEAVAQNWSAWALRQIGTHYYEQLLAGRDREPVRQEAIEQIVLMQKATREFVRTPVLLEFLGLLETGRLLEADLEQALTDELQSFLLELGNGFAFVARQMLISTETKDFYIDLVFYNYLLKCFVFFDLKAGELIRQYIGQMDMYVRMVDNLKLAPDDNPAASIIIYAGKGTSVVRYSVLHENEQLFASKCKLVLTSEDELGAELERANVAGRAKKK